MNASSLGFPYILRSNAPMDENALQFIYEKSRVHYLFPILLLFAYSLLGGLIFWSIEKSHEEVLLMDKTILEELVNATRSVEVSIDIA
uniref:Dolichol-phosphate mannosyltransferase subunit 3 n=1 Tax=Heterorhabditis bacteriophora TaxID=37862 RepID=A0A1I7XG90_HETBA